MLGRAAADALRSGPRPPGAGRGASRQGRGRIVRRRQCVPAGASAPVTVGILRRPEGREPAPPLARSRRRKPWRFLLAVLGGLLLLLAFLRFDPPAPGGSGPGRGGRSPPPPLARSRRRKPWRFLLAVLGGLLLLLAFLGFDLPALAPLGVAALALAVRGRRARAGFWLGLVFGLT